MNQNLSNSRPYTIGAFIAIIAILIFIIFHILRIILKEIRRHCGNPDTTAPPVEVLSIPRESEGRKVSASCIHGLEEEVAVDEASRVEKVKRSQSQRVRRESDGRRSKRMTKSVRICEKSRGLEFMAGCSHRYAEEF